MSHFIAKEERQKKYTKSKTQLEIKGEKQEEELMNDKKMKKKMKKKKMKSS